MQHVFVETNWLHDYAAPAHHKVPDAVTLLERARRGEFTLHITFPMCRLGRRASRSSQSASRPTVPGFIDTFGGHTGMAN